MNRRSQALCLLRSICELWDTHTLTNTHTPVTITIKVITLALNFTLRVGMSHPDRNFPSECVWVRNCWWPSCIALTKTGHLISQLTHSFTSYVLFCRKVSCIAVATYKSGSRFITISACTVIKSMWTLLRTVPFAKGRKNSLPIIVLPPPSLFIHLPPPDRGLGESLVKHEVDVLCSWHSFITSFLGKWLRDEDFLFSPAASLSLLFPLGPSFSF